MNVNVNLLVFSVLLSFLAGAVAFKKVPVTVNPRNYSVPYWPDTYTSVWNQYLYFHEDPKPPYAAGAPPMPYTTYQGTTFYDWPNQRMVQFMDSPAFAGLGCRYGNGQCKMVNFNDPPDGQGPIAYSWMTTGPHAGECCIEQRVAVLPPDFVKDLTPQKNFNLTTPGKPDEVVEWFATDDGDFFMGFYQNKFITDSEGKDTEYQWSAMHGGHQFFGLPGWRWETYLSFVLGPPPPGVFDYPKNCLVAPNCSEAPHPFPTPPPTPVSLLKKDGFGVGAAIGGGLGFVVAGVLFFVCCRRKKQNGSLNSHLL